MLEMDNKVIDINCYRRNNDIPIILGTIGNDCHRCANIVLEMFFKDKGFDVINLGSMVKIEEFANAAKEHNAKAVLISSINGHSVYYCKNIRDYFSKNNQDDTIIYVGGNLSIKKSALNTIKKELLSYGIDRVFDADCDLDEVNILLRQDIEEVNRKPIAVNQSSAV